MPMFELTSESLNQLEPDNFRKLGILERFDMQPAIRANINAITPEVDTMVLAEEFNSWDGSSRRIDLLCLDSKKNLVVVELKRDDSAHMDLQAIRYAAMVSTILFEQAVDAHRAYLAKRGSDADPEQAIREFLQVDADELVAFSDKVRIVLASSEFSPELTTAVLWLNQQGDMDIRCVQMLPYAIASRVFLDIQQLIPLPQAQQYMVRVREKTVDQEKVRVAASRKAPRYNLTIGESFAPNLERAELLLALVREAIRQGVTPDAIIKDINWKRPKVFLSVSGAADEDAMRAQYPDADEYFLAEQDRFFVRGKAYVFHAVWGAKTLQAADIIKGLMPDQSAVYWEPAGQVPREVQHDDYVIRRKENGSIEIEKGGKPVATSTIAVLRELAAKLEVPTTYETSGEDTNTRILGARVMAAIHACITS